MTDEIKNEATKRLRGAQKVFFKFLTAMILLAGAFMTGVYWERSDGSVCTLLKEAYGVAVAKPLPPEAQEDAGPIDPAVLEARLTEQIRAMHSEISRLDDEAKEGRIHYNLLLHRGYSKSDDVCISLVTRQQEIKDRIEDIQAGAWEAEVLRRRLMAAIDDRMNSRDSSAVDKSLRTESLRVINRADLLDGDQTVIPDTLWKAPEETDGMNQINRR